MAGHGGSGGGSGGGVLRELIAVFGFGVDTEELEEGENRLEKFFGKLKELGTVLAEIFAVKEVYEFAEAQARAMTQIERTAGALGISTDRVQQFQFAAEALGQESGTLLNLMGRMQVVQQAAASGSAQAAKGFEAVGIKIHELKGMSADQLFLRVADGIADIKDPAKAAAASVALFGKQGRVLLPFLKEGADGFQELVEEYKQLGGGYPEEAIEKAKEFEHQQARLSLASRGLKGVIAAQLLPIISKLVSWITLGVAKLREWAKQSEVVKATLLVLGSAMGYFAARVLLANIPLLLMTAAIAALILLVDSFLVMMEGGQSVIGDAIDAMFGKDQHLETVRTLKELWDDIGGAIKTAWEYVVKFFEKLTEYGGELGDFLGKIHNAFGQDANKRLGEIVVNKIQAKKRAEAETKETRKKAAAYLDREVLGQEDTSPQVPFGPTTEGAAYVPPNFAPLITPTPPANAQSNYVQQDVKIDVHAAPGMDEKKLAQHTADEFRKLKKQSNRATAATFQRLNPSGAK